MIDVVKIKLPGNRLFYEERLLLVNGSYRTVYQAILRRDNSIETERAFPITED